MLFLGHGDSLENGGDGIEAFFPGHLGEGGYISFHS
jgi:hypothetical protein